MKIRKIPLAIFAIAVFGCSLVVFCSKRAYKYHTRQPTYTFPADTMAPSYFRGDRVFVTKFASGNFGIKRGDVVAYKYPAHPGEITVGRIIGMPGQYIEMRMRRVYSNHKAFNLSPLPIRACKPSELKKEYSIDVKFNCFLENAGKVSYKVLWQADNADPTTNFKPVFVPRGYYYILKDNRSFGPDSRATGPVPQQDILALVRQKIQP